MTTPWLERLAGAVPPADQYLFGVAIIDPSTGDVVGHNGRIPGGAAPTLRGLFAAGTASEEDFDDLMEQAGEEPDSAATVSSTARVSTATGTEAADRYISWVPSPLTGEPAVSVVVQLHSETIEAATGPPPSRRAAINYLYDRELNIVAADPYMDGYTLTPARHLGVSSLLLVHPEDLALGQPLMHSVAKGERRSVDYIVRGAGPFGMWPPVHIELRSLLAETPMFLATVEPIAPNRKPLPLDALTDREQDIVFALFRGLRVPQVCARFEISEKTVRNQLSTVYRKLSVATQAELLEQYARPTRTVAQLTPGT